ncbi:hypothetical protein DM02DRAFT_620054, partial [Periconia macrospinosa]
MAASRTGYITYPRRPMKFPKCQYQNKRCCLCQVQLYDGDLVCATRFDKSFQKIQKKSRKFQKDGWNSCCNQGCRSMKSRPPFWVLHRRCLNPFTTFIRPQDLQSVLRDSNNIHVVVEIARVIGKALYDMDTTHPPDPEICRRRILQDATKLREALSEATNFHKTMKQRYAKLKIHLKAETVDYLTRYLEEVAEKLKSAYAPARTLELGLNERHIGRKELKGLWKNANEVWKEIRSGIISRDEQRF